MRNLESEKVVKRIMADVTPGYYFTHRQSLEESAARDIAILQDGQAEWSLENIPLLESPLRDAGVIYQSAQGRKYFNGKSEKERVEFVRKALETQLQREQAEAENIRDSQVLFAQEEAEFLGKRKHDTWRRIQKLSTYLQEIDRAQSS